MRPPLARRRVAPLAWLTLSLALTALAACGSPERATEPVTRADEVSPTTPPPAGVVPAGGDGWSVVSVGTNHSCALTVDGRAYCWGENRAAQLGIVDAPDVCGPPAVACARAPVPVATDLRFVRLAVGGAHACAMDAGGSVHCWGDNTFGQLGLASPRIAAEPVPVQGGHRFTDVSAGEYHSCALRTDGAVLCWGRNENGELGRGALGSGSVPIVVRGEIAFATVAAGPGRTCGTTAGGETYCWGRIWLYTDGGLEWSRRQLIPSLVPEGAGLRGLTIGSLATCALGTGDVPHCWEANGFGQLGIGAMYGVLEPTPVAGGRAFRSVSAGSIQTCGIAVDLRGWCWGNNSFGQLGDHGVRSACPPSGLPCAPAPVSVRGALRFVSLATGPGNHVCGVTTLTNLYCWGLGIGGQLGDGDPRTVIRYEPVRVAPRSE